MTGNRLLAANVDARRQPPKGVRVQRAEFTTKYQGIQAACSFDALLNAAVSGSKFERERQN